MNSDEKVLVVEGAINEGNDAHPFEWLELIMLMIGGKESSTEPFFLNF